MSCFGDTTIKNGDNISTSKVMQTERAVVLHDTQLLPRLVRFPLVASTFFRLIVYRQKQGIITSQWRSRRMPCRSCRARVTRAAIPMVNDRKNHMARSMVYGTQKAQNPVQSKV
jgi:hypothetical protein